MKHFLISLLILTGLRLSAQSGIPAVIQANQLMNEGQYRAAQEYYEAAIRQEPTNANLYAMLGFCMHKQKYYTKADSFYRKSIEMDSTPSKPYWYKAMNHKIMRQDSSAIVNYKKFIKIESQKGGRLLEAYRDIGQCYEHMLRKDGLYDWQIDEMIYYFELLVNNDPSNTDVPLIKNFLEMVKSKRPANQSGKWKLER